jgi:two-component system chemotaxis response regulator CheB
VTGTLRLVLVEDSMTQRAHLRRLLEAEGDIKVVAEATDAGSAVDEVARHRPDVVTMDLDMPGGGGQGAIARIMAETPTPILVLSGVIDTAAAAPAVGALAAGAVDALPKPRRWTEEAAGTLRRQVRTVAGVSVVGRRRGPAFRPASSAGGAVVGIGASTGGPAAVATLLGALPAVPAPVMLVQHIHPSFVAGFVSWLAGAIDLPVELAEHGATLRDGHVYVAPGDVHMRLAARRKIALDPEPPSVHRPSIDVLFHSIAALAGDRSVGVLLTGMGEDGAQGLLAMRTARGATMAQDADSCVVFGMPRAAERVGAVERMLPPTRLAAAVVRAVGDGGRP